MSGRDGAEDSPQDIDAAFAQIVADLQREGIGRSLPEDEPRRRQTAAPVEEEEPPPRPAEASWRGYNGEFDTFNDNEDEHYEPPEPPPLPRLRWPTMLAIGLMVVGIVLLVLPAVTALDGRFATPVGLLALAGGIATLLLRARTTSRLEPGDDGAEV